MTSGEFAVCGSAAEDPYFFFQNILQWRPWSKQMEVADAVWEGLKGEGPKRVAVRSANGTGKTALAARIMLWAVGCFPGTVAVTTAPTMRQVNDLLWREARDAYRSARINLGGYFYEGQARWERDAKSFAVGLSPDHTRPERFQGFHADRILFIVDEASGVPEAHWEAIKGSALAGNAVILAIGNPTRLHGEFHDAFHRQAHLWRRLHISAFDTPNFREPGLSDPEQRIAGLVTPEAVETARAEWGQDSPLYRVRVLGEFPWATSNQLIQLEWVEEAREVPGDQGPPALGVDVARSGDGETVLALLFGNRLERLQAWRGQDTMRTVGAVKGYAEGLRELLIAVDDGGVGGGVVDRLRELDVRVYGVKFGGAPDGRLGMHFKNKASEMYWALREHLREGRLSLGSPSAGCDDKLVAQLLQLEWEQESDRVIRVYKRGRDRSQPSPDRADALALALEAQALRNKGPGVWIF